MMISTQKLIATSLALLLSSSAFAGASLSSLLGGGTLTSNNGNLLFSDFEFSPAPAVSAAADIEVTTLDNGLLFGSPIFIDSLTGIIDFGVSYKVTAINSQIVGAGMQTNGAYSGELQADVTKVISDSQGNLLAELTNQTSTGNLSDSDSVSFAAQGSLDILDGVSAFGAGGTGAEGFAEVQQTFETLDVQTDSEPSDPTSVPSPTAALAGLALLGIVGMRRRRG